LTTSTSPKKSKSALGNALRMVEQFSIVGLDLETSGRNPREAGIRLFQVSDGKKTYVVDAWHVDVTPLVEALVKVDAVIAHNADFEWRFLYHDYGVELDNLQDTLLMAQLVAAGDKSVPCGLGPIVSREFGVELDKDVQVSDWTLKKLTKRQLDYAAMDAHVLVPLHAKLTSYLKRAGLERVAQIENAALPAVTRMRYEGMPVDKAAWDRHAKEVEAQLKALKREMLEAEWMPEWDPVPQAWKLSGPECKEMLEKTLGISIPGTTAKDLKPLAENHLIVEKLLAYRKAKGEERENLKAIVLEHAAEKPPAPPWAR